MNRTKALLTLRPEVSSATNDSKTSPEETFQNRTLRPIIKFQHDLVLRATTNMILKFHKDFSLLTIEKQTLKIDALFNSNNQLKNELRGIIVGLFSLEEFEVYTTMRTDINKRIIQIIKERVISTL